MGSLPSSTCASRHRKRVWLPSSSAIKDPWDMMDPTIWNTLGGPQAKRVMKWKEHQDDLEELCGPSSINITKIKRLASGVTFTFSSGKDMELTGPKKTRLSICSNSFSKW
ncbi:predicted protein [Lichtheimia corymbifera JMRC:FSU:9682]|uniref:Uncharacterized protein n=1 Tax=Lichtheimia corymbifera JMRC:FSU:9682 TaxID=1263082 RepID=A0A068RG23_9FUNG|nr:predicted protein [Lichtheimia corymbifera JMRC:FSU:9682]